MARDFSIEVKVNRYRLDGECEEHASRYHYWAEELATSKGEVDAAGDQLKFILADEEMAIRVRLETEGGKFTEGTVKANLEVSKRVLDARETLRAASVSQYHLEAAVRAMDHRKSELDNLTVLFSKAYYSKPGNQGPETIQDQVAGDVRKKLNRKEQ